MPEHEIFTAAASESGQPEAADEDRIEAAVERLRGDHDVIVIDTPGSDNPLNRMAHSLADVLVTPLNDSLVDFDVLARVDGARMKVLGPSHYAEMIWEQKMKRAQRGRRFHRLDRHAQPAEQSGRPQQARDGAAPRRIVGARRFPLRRGFRRRVVYRELFLKGLTMMDLREIDGVQKFTLSHLAARQEVRSLIEAFGFP